MTAALNTWWMILRISLQERLVYRGDFALGTLMRFLPIVTQIFLWSAVFHALPGGETSIAALGILAAAGLEKLIAGYSYQEFVAYYLLTMVARAFSSMPGLSSQIAGQIRSGEIKKFLIQPIDPLSFLLLSRVAHKLAYYTIAVGPFALVFFLCRSYFPGWPDVLTLLAFVASLILSFLLGYFLEACLGLVGFWMLEVSSLLFVYMLFSFFLSGHMFPIDMLKDREPWGTIISALPLQYLAYFPAAVCLGKVKGWDLVSGLAQEAGWVLFFIILSRVLWIRGTRRYSAYGG